MTNQEKLTLEELAQFAQSIDPRSWVREQLSDGSTMYMGELKGISVYVGKESVSNAFGEAVYELSASYNRHTISEHRILDPEKILAHNEKEETKHLAKVIKDLYDQVSALIDPQVEREHDESIKNATNLIRDHNLQFDTYIPGK